MRILVCGGRDYADRSKVFRVLSQAEPTVIVTGDAAGADTLAAEYARAMCIPLFQFFANWNKYGKPAGPKRNTQMLEVGKPDMVIAFPGRHGTADMKRQAEAAGIKVVAVE